MNMRIGDIAQKPLVTELQPIAHEDIQQPVVSENTSQKQEAEQQRLAISSDQLQSVTDELNRTMDVLNHALRFTVRDDKQLQVQVIDSQSKKVIREIPPEEMLDLADKIKEMVKSFSHVVGMFVDELI